MYCNHKKERYKIFAFYPISFFIMTEQLTWSIIYWYTIDNEIAINANNVANNANMLSIIAIVVGSIWTLLWIILSIRLWVLLHKKGLKQKLYSEDVMCSIVAVKSPDKFKSCDMYNNKINYDWWILKVYSQDNGISRHYQVISLMAYEGIEWWELIDFYEDILHPSRWYNPDEVKFSTKWACIEYVIEKHWFDLLFNETPYKKDKRYN